MCRLGCFCAEGMNRFPQDWAKALELWHRAAELGYETSYYNIGLAYSRGEGVARDGTKAKQYFELAALGGDAEARHNLGNVEGRAGNIDKALRHFIIAVEFGDNESLKIIQQMHSIGHATKDDYAEALRAYQAYLEEIRSDDRDKAAAFSDIYKIIDDSPEVN